MKVTKFQPGGLDTVLGGALTGSVSTAGSANALNGVVVGNAAGSNQHFVSISSNYGLWVDHTDSGSSPVTQVWEAVTDGEDVFVWDGDDLVHEWRDL